MAYRSLLKIQTLTFWVAILLTVSSCLESKIKVTLVDKSPRGSQFIAAQVPTATINQAVNEIVGTCNFSAPTDPIASSGFEYRVTFSEVIDATSFTTADISNAGGGGLTTLNWTIDNCGDDTNFKLTASVVVGDGSIIPTIFAGRVTNSLGNGNLISTATDNSVTFDNTSPTVTVNQATTTTVGSCSFTAPSDPSNATSLEYRVLFSEAIAPVSLTTADISNSGTGGATALTWTLDSCGDNRNFKLTASAITGDGTIVPVIGAGLVSDLAGNTNSASTATDNSVLLDTNAPTVTVNQATTQTVGSCTFTATADPSSAAPFEYKVVFSEAINPVTFTTTDIYNSGTGGTTTLTWALSDCGDNTNFKLAATVISGLGTVMPEINSGLVSDLASNTNSASTSADNSITLVSPGWYQEAYIKAVNGEASDSFGKSVAISGDTLAVGAMGEDSNQTTITNGATANNDNSSLGSGAVYIYKRSGNSWSQEAYIKAVNADGSDNFGHVVALSGDTLVVATPFEASNQTTITNGSTASLDNSVPASGAAYVYKRSGVNWSQEAYIKAVNAESIDLLGRAISISGDTIVVNAYAEDSNQTNITSGATASSDNSIADSGAAYVYKRTGVNWAQQAYIKATSSSTNDYFGTSVSISGDTLAVSMDMEDSNQTTITNGVTSSSDNSNTASGAVYVYKRTGVIWAQDAYIKATNNNNNDQFGNSVSISGDTLAVGALLEDSNETIITNGTTASGDNSSANSGAVYIYKRAGGIWSQEAYIKAANSDGNDNFGGTVSVSGNTLAVGAYQEDSNQTTITNGATASSDNSNTDSGAVYVYKRLGVNWSQEAYIKAANADSSDTFGQSLSLSGDTLAVGAYQEDSNQTTITNGDTASADNSATDSGAVYLYRHNSRLFEAADIYSQATTDTYVYLHWVNGGQFAAGYQIAYSAGSTAPVDCNSGTVLDVGDVDGYQVTGLIPNSDYTFRVCSYSIGHASYSEGVSITFKTLALVPEVTTLSAVSNGPIPTQIDLSWSSGGGSTTGFKVAHQAGALPPADCSAGVDVAAATSYAATGLIEGTLYAFRVCAYDGSANSSLGMVIAATTGTSGWYQEAYIKAVNGDSSDFYGRDVSLSGDTLVVGANEEDSNQITITNGATASADNSTLTSGAVYVYKRSGSVWGQEAYIKSVNSNALDYFGTTVAISGNTLAVGAMGEASNQTTITNGTTASANNGNVFSGAVYVYKRSGLNWSQEAYIKAANNNISDSFGTSFSLSGDTLTVGAGGEDSNQTTITNGTTASTNNSALSSGAVYVYRRSGVTWAQEAYIKASNSGADDFFGTVSVSGDTIAVGASGEDSNQTIITNGTTSSADNSAASSGAVYIYKRTGSTWAQEAYLKAVNGEANDQFGTSVSLSGDTLAVGVPGEDSNQTSITNGATASADNSASASGAVYIYKRVAGSWAQEAYIKAMNGGSSDDFGRRISFSGNTLAVGAPNEYSNQTTITNGGAASSDNSLAGSGAVYIYKRTGNSWAQEAYIKAFNSSYDDGFGSAVSFSGDTVAVNALDEDSSQTTITNGSSASFDNSSYRRGAVYVYRNNTRLFEASDLFVSNYASTYLDLTWSSAGSLAAGYQIAYQSGTTPPADCSLGTVVDPGNVLTYQVSGLTSGTNYSFRICSYTAGHASYSEGYTVTFRTAIPPDVTTLQAFPDGPITSLMHLSWVSGGGTTTGFTVSYLSGVTAPADCTLGTVVDNGVATTLDVGGLTAGTAYSFRVCSYDAFGSKSPGTTATATTSTAGWYQEAYIKAVNNGAGDEFGTVVSLSGDTVAIGAYYEDSNQTIITNGSTASANNSSADSGAVYVYKRSGSSWSQEAYIKSANGDTLDNFGQYISLSYNTLVVGARWEDSNQTTITNGATASSDNSSNSSGAVYVYKRTGSTWVQEAYIKATNAGNGDFFGGRVELNGDTLAVSAGSEDSNQTSITNGAVASTDNSFQESGAVYIYRRNGSIWTQEAYIKRYNSKANSYFATSLSISGESLAVGATYDSSDQTTITNGLVASLVSLGGGGALFIYSRTGVYWSQEAYIKAINRDAGDSFGASVSLAGDTVAIGASQEGSNQSTITNGATASADNSMTSVGAVYIYKRTAASWAQEAYIKAVNRGSFDFFGSSVSLRGDTLSVGTGSEDSNQTTITNGIGASADNSSDGSGAVYIYKRVGTNWSQEAFIKAINNGGSDLFGGSVSLSGDTVAVGARREDSNQITITNGASASANNSSGDSGAVYIYRNNIRLFDVGDLYASAITESYIDLSWTTAGMLAAGYQIAYKSGATPPVDCISDTIVDVGNVYVQSITGLTLNTLYSFRICSYTAGQATFSEGVTMSFRTASPVPEPTNLVAIPNGPTPTRIDLSWDSGGGVTTGFTVAYLSGVQPPIDCTSGTVIDNGASTTLALTGLAEGSYYAIRVCAYDGSADHSAGAVLAAKTETSGWYQEAYIKATNNYINDQFGYSISLNGDTLAVGANLEDSNETTITNGVGASSDDSSADSGAVYVYKRTGEIWAQEAYIKAVNNDSGDQFGSSISLNGNTLAVSATYEDSNQSTITNGAGASGDNSSANSGAVYVYKRTGVTWAQEAYIKASNNSADDRFGSLSLNGDTLVVGVSREDSNQTTITNGVGASSDDSSADSGAVYVYKRTGVTWAQEAYVKAANSDLGDNFGNISIDGDTLVVGALQEDSNQTTITNGVGVSVDNTSANSGAAYIYKRTGEVWAQEAYVKAVNNDAGDFFGTVSISGDTLAVGAPMEASNQTTITNGSTASTDDSFAWSGAVYVYKRVGTNWAQEAYIKAANAQGGDMFGGYFSLEGNTLAVSSISDDSGQNTITNGAGAATDNSAMGSGAVFVYKRTGSTWAQEAYIKAANNTGFDDFFSYTISLSGDTIAVGAYLDNSNQNTITNGIGASFDRSSIGSGAIHVFRNNTRLFEPADIYLSEQTSTYLTLTWNNSGLLAAGYQIAYQAGTTPPADCTSGTVVDVGNVLTHSITGLAVNTEYSFRICLYNAGKAQMTEGFTISYRTTQLPPNPTGLVIAPNPRTPTSVDLSWSSGGFPTYGYKIDYLAGAIAPADCSGGVDVGLNTNYEVTTLNYNSEYSFRVCAYDSTGLLSSGLTGTDTTYDLGWYQEAYIKAVNNSVDDHFGSPLSLSGETLAVGAVGEDSDQITITNGTTAYIDESKSNSGAVYIYKRTGSSWAQEAFIKAANSDADDLFGQALSLNQDSLAVGAFREDSNQNIITNGATADSNNSNPDSGALYIYKRSGSTWSQEAYIKAVNNGAGDGFGGSVTLNGDTVAVGAINESSNQTTITNGATASADNSNSNSGAVYVYGRTGSTWNQEAYIKAVNNNANDGFGSSVALSADTLAVGAYCESSNQSTITNGATASADNSMGCSGAIYVYKRVNSSWSQEAYIKAVNSGTDDALGTVLSLSGDILVAGVESEDSDQTTITNGTTASINNLRPNSGAVYVYKRTGSNWDQEAYIKAVNSNTLDSFGIAVSIKGDTLVVGSYSEASNQTVITNGTSASSDNSYISSGALYVYKRTGGVWVQEAYIKASNNDGNDEGFGYSCYLSGDTIAVGSYYEDSNQTTITNGRTASSDNTNTDSGAVYIYRNNARLFDPSDLYVTGVTDTEMTLNWTWGGALVAGYQIAYLSGDTPPADCSLGTVADVLDVSSHQVTGLTADTNYSFRVCSYNSGQVLFSEGITTTFRTAP